MNALDYVVLVVTVLGIAGYGMWKTRGGHDLKRYLKGRSDTRWITIGLSVMATQASAITFLSTPGQGYEDGMGFVQNYFGAPLALIVIAAVFLPLYRRLNVYTAYEFLGHRFDTKTRLLGAALFLVQRGLGAGITIYAPAIVLSTVMGWSLTPTILCSGLVVIVYTVFGGSEAVNLTQKYQIGVIFVGMAAAFGVVLGSLPRELSMTDTLALAGGFGKLNAVDFSLNLHTRYTFWSGLLGGMFLALSYFGTDQSQVQRYLSGASLRESRLGLMFNAVFKIPMQAFILLLGVLIFVFYQFEQPPVYFNRTAWQEAVSHDRSGSLRAAEGRFQAAHAEEARNLAAWVNARSRHDPEGATRAQEAVRRAHDEVARARAEASRELSKVTAKAGANDSDYVFITFIVDHLPHGLIGLLVAAFFAAALSSKAGELNALGSTTTIDFYRPLVSRSGSDAHHVLASRVFTAAWGLVAVGFALFATLTENLIQAVNIIGSLFYGVVLGLFLIAFFFKRIGGTAAFWSAILGQIVVLVLFWTLSISYLWYNVIGCVACIVLGLILQAFLPARESPASEALKP